MTARLASSVRAQAQIWLARYGAGWPLAALLAVAAAAIHMAALAPTRAAVADAREQLAHTAEAGASRPAPAAPRNEAQQLQAARDVLPAASEATAQIGQLEALARSQQIALTQADYAQRTHAAIGMVQLQVTQPIKAGYPQVRRYIEAVLRAMPNVSLDQVVARRDNVAQSQLEVRLRWSMWLRAPGAPEEKP